MIRHFFERRLATLSLWFCPLCVALALPASADQGEPLAIRTWPEGVVSIETHWDFEVVVDLYHAQSLPQELAQADLVITRGSDQPGKLRVQFQPVPKNEIDPPGQPTAAVVSHWPISDLNLYLDRVANESQQTLLANDEATFVSKNAVTISHVEERLLLLVADGVRVALPLEERFAVAEEALPIDVLILNPDKDADEQSVAAELLPQVQLLNPRWSIISAPLKTPPDVPPTDLPSTVAVGNTWAVAIDSSDAEPQVRDQPLTKWVQLRTTPWEMPAELSELFERKELACRASQRTFAGLSVAQMNFKPANGSHTPRWNSEHMMGRELLFFTQIYAQRSPEVKVIDLNPKQMPPDYEPRHADWDGREEARQMERVSRCTRRFAYLLDGLKLDEPAPGSAWTLSKLLIQMDKHYTEHTANVVKKFELPDWPQE